MKSVIPQSRWIRAALLAIALAAFLKTDAAEAAPLGRYLVDLESHIKWSAVDNAWREIRPRWVARTAACDNSACVARQLLELETHVTWESVEPVWRKRRNSWVRECETARTHAETANLMLEFERNVHWHAVDEAWRARRAGWIEGVRND